ncbi:hypothetical protein A33M_4024 [Rhodovulum sp. PH10]|nr:hypothetical protein A33M_4024 [Rhodovulum sp. PH10]
MKKPIIVSALAIVSVLGVSAALAQPSRMSPSEHESHHPGATAQASGSDNSGSAEKSGSDMMGGGAMSGTMQGMMGRGGMHGSGMMGATGSDMMGAGMMGAGMMGAGMMGAGMAKMMVVMMDANGDGTVARDEFQAVHARMFKAMDANGDGKLSADEVGSFCGGMQTGSVDTK